MLGKDGEQILQLPVQVPYHNQFGVLGRASLQPLHAREGAEEGAGLNEDPALVALMQWHVRVRRKVQPQRIHLKTECVCCAEHKSAMRTVQSVPWCSASPCALYTCKRCAEGEKS